MKIKKTLAALALALAAGCGTKRVVVNGGVYNPHQDVNGDSRVDAVFAVAREPKEYNPEGRYSREYHHHLANRGSYDIYVFYKPGLEGGGLGEPEFLYKTSSLPCGMPFEFVSDGTTRGRVILGLMNQADNRG
jgi:hypothetical protein